MLPFQRNKIDISVRLIHFYRHLQSMLILYILDWGCLWQKLSPQEQQLFSKYGKLPTHKNVLMKMQKVRCANAHTRLNPEISIGPKVFRFW